MEGYIIRPDITQEELDEIFEQMLYDYVVYGTCSYIMKPKREN